MTSGDQTLTLQRIIFPETGICTEQELYFQVEGAVGYASSGESLFLGIGGYVTFDTYFNLFSLGKWTANGDIGRLHLEISLQGKTEVSVVHVRTDGSQDVILSEIVDHIDPATVSYDLSRHHDRGADGVLYFRLRAMEPTIFLGGRFWCDREINPDFSLAVSITTFRREAEVQNTAERFERFLSTYQFADRVQVLVIDNGQSAEIENSEKITKIDNVNFGGSGGFARGLIEARERGMTHCLFMDDDASFHMENIRRTIAFLGLSKHENAVVAGAMIGNARKWELWENGATFNRVNHPQHIKLDLREPENILQLERESASETRDDFYGGWWYFAFPLAHAEHLPFPYFVRGDDVSFSLANDFQFNLLNGIVSFQDEFSAKQSPTTLYLDLRSQLMHHLVFPAIELSRVGIALVALRFILRTLVRFHYESAEAQLMALKDLLKGPQTYGDSPDAAKRREQVKQLTDQEKWRPIEGYRPKPDDYTKPPNRLAHLIWVFTLNGHLLPLFKLVARRGVVPMEMREALIPVWGRKELTYLNWPRDQYYTVRHSKIKFYGYLFRLALPMAQLVFRHNSLKKTYREAYPELTSTGYWKGKMMGETKGD